MRPNVAISEPDFPLWGWLSLAAIVLAAALVFVLAGDNIGLKVAAMFGAVAAAAAIVRFDLAHPYIWFGGAFAIYSSAGPLLFWLGVHPYTYWGGWDVRELDFSGAMDFEFYALMAALLAIGPRRVSFAPALNDPRLSYIVAGAPLVAAFAAIAAAISVATILGSGFEAKTDYVLQGGWGTRFSFGFNILATALGVYMVGLSLRDARAKRSTMIVLALVLGAIVILLVGQRHFLFRIAIVFLMAMHILGRRIRISVLIGIAFAGLIAGNLLGGAKMVLVNGDTDLLSLFTGWDDSYELLFLQRPELAADSELVRNLKLLLTAALGSEAMTAGNNLAMILTHWPREIGAISASSMLHDFARAVLPGFLVAPSVESTGDIYNRVIFPQVDAAGGGTGFSVVGYGYIYFGWAGAILMLAAIGWAIGLLYRFAGRSGFGLLFYIGFVPVGAYIARNDLSGPLSQGLKHVFLPLVLMGMIGVIARSMRPFEASRWRFGGLG